MEEETLQKTCKEALIRHCIWTGMLLLSKQHSIYLMLQVMARTYVTCMTTTQGGRQKDLKFRTKWRSLHRGVFISLWLKSTINLTRWSQSCKTPMTVPLNHLSSKSQTSSLPVPLSHKLKSPSSSSLLLPTCLALLWEEVQEEKLGLLNIRGRHCGTLNSFSWSNIYPRQLTSGW